MRALKGNRVFRLFMVLVAAVQMAAVMPHHHHKFSDIPCLNPLHSLEAHAHNGSHPGGLGHDCNDSGCEAHLCLHNTSTHGHEQNGSGEQCGMLHLELNPPVRDRVAFIVPVTGIADTFTFIPDQLRAGLCPEHGNGGDVVCCSVFGGMIALYCHICASSIPARAPSFLV